MVNEGPQKDYSQKSETREHDVSPREQMLRNAIKITCKERTGYGTPYQNMKQTSELFNAYLANRPLARLGTTLDAHDMAVFMILAKISRLATTPNHEDSWTDIAAYAGIGFECAAQENSKALNFITSKGKE